MNNFKQILSSPASLPKYEILFAEASASHEVFFEIFELMFDADEKIAWHASWVCEKVSERSPHFYTEKQLERIVALAVSTNFTGLQRLLLSIILNLGLPAEVSVEFINTCFERMVSLKSPVAVQVLSMKILYEFTQRESDFKGELKNYLESVDVENYSAGYRSARKTVLKKL